MSNLHRHATRSPGALAADGGHAPELGQSHTSWCTGDPENANGAPGGTLGTQTARRDAIVHCGGEESSTLVALTTAIKANIAKSEWGSGHGVIPRGREQPMPNVAALLRRSGRSAAAARRLKRSRSSTCAARHIVLEEIVDRQRVDLLAI